MNPRMLVLVGTLAVLLLAGCTGTSPTDSIGPVETPDAVAPTETPTPADPSRSGKTADGSTETPGTTGTDGSREGADGAADASDGSAETQDDQKTPAATRVETVATGDRTPTGRDGTASGGTATGTEGTDTATSTRTPIYRTGGPCTDVWVSFWGLPAAEFWDRDKIRVGVRIGGNASLLLVVEADDSVVGVDAFTSPESGLSASGYVLELDEPLAGTTSLTVTVHADRDRDGEYDHGVDRPCYDGGVVRAGPTTVDFEAVGNGTDAS